VRARAPAVKLLLQYYEQEGLDINAPDEQGNTPLHVACLYSRVRATVARHTRTRTRTRYDLTNAIRLIGAERGPGVVARLRGHSSDDGERRR
jgi:hypothetical protein